MPMATPEAQREYQRNWVAKRRLDWFSNKACAWCGSCDNLELDHIDPATKISHNIWSWSVERRNRELEKCQVLCAPCHINKTTINGDHARGINVATSRLNDNLVQYIKRSYPHKTQYELATELNVHQKTIWSVLSGRTWKHVN
jgi:5-methylcytosine-specific restriction endonuclease McrA